MDTFTPIKNQKQTKGLRWEPCSTQSTRERPPMKGKAGCPVLTVAPSVSSTLPRTNSLICPLITSSFNCTIFSDMACCLLSEWCVATSFYQRLQTVSLFISFSICATYSTLSHHLWRSVQGHPLHQTKRSPLCRVHQPQKYLGFAARDEQSAKRAGCGTAQGYGVDRTH